MIKFEHVEVYGWEAAIRGMRNPKNSWERSDSVFVGKYSFGENDAVLASIGPNDHKLMMTLRNAGTDHRKFMRFINVTVDITAPLYWWKEFDTYKVGTVADSCSTMHKIQAKEFTLEDFSHEHMLPDGEFILCLTIDALNDARDVFNDINNRWGKDLLCAELSERENIKESRKLAWWQMIQLLPSSYNQKRTVQLNYEVLANIYKSRKNHKLDEWSDGFMAFIKSLPYSELITGETLDCE